MSAAFATPENDTKLKKNNANLTFMTSSPCTQVAHPEHKFYAHSRVETRFRHLFPGTAIPGEKGPSSGATNGEGNNDRIKTIGFDDQRCATGPATKVKPIRFF